MIHRILLFMMLMSLSQTAHSQNKIDQMVERFSTVGHGTFTSAVKRDPKTRRVKTVVKMLESQGEVIGNLRDAFAKMDSESGYERKMEGGRLMVTFWTESSREHRIYTLNCDRSAYPSGKVTIIIIYRQ